MRNISSLSPLAILLIAIVLPAYADSDLATITRLSGRVNVLVRGAPVAAHVGARFEVPARIETGNDGSLRVEQVSSTLDIGPNSVVLLQGTLGGKEPVLSESKGPGEKIIQNLGRVLYSVKPRSSRSFAVETPYLVSVVKGTMFSVAIENESTQVSLLEGSVEVTAEGIEPILLHPNEVARRSAAQRVIEVTKIDSIPSTSPRAEALEAPAPSLDANSLSQMQPEVVADLNEITAAYQLQRTTPGAGPSVPSSPVPTTPDSGPPTSPTPSTPAADPSPASPDAPASDPDPTPADPTPSAPDPDPTPVTPVDDEDSVVSECGRKKCDSPDDHDNGRGNDDK